jgi:ubiquinone/menaquinone biosynthesis C-methylase UbiE
MLRLLVKECDAMSDHMRECRAYELTQVLPWLNPGSRVLEIGAGAGWQAKELAEQGFLVEAIDLETSTYADRRVYPVKHYDGHNIPFPDGTFDVVFSAHVLEYVERPEDWLDETARVLKSSGTAVHILPSASCRFWSLATYYPYWVKTFLALLFPKAVGRDVAAARIAERRSDYSAKGFVKKAASVMMVPKTHGVRGNFLTELHYLSRRYWTPLFRNNGWRVEKCFPIRLFYTQHGLLKEALSLSARHALSYVLGGSCLVYVLKRKT